MKHTQGPWSLGQTIGLRQCVIDSKSNKICKVFDERNAELLAVAPEMYDLLVSLIEPMRHRETDDSHIDKVMELLQKARGE